MDFHWNSNGFHVKGHVFDPKRQHLWPHRLKAKLCKLKRDLLEPSGGGGGKAAGFEVRVRAFKTARKGFET